MYDVNKYVVLDKNKQNKRTNSSKMIFTVTDMNAIKP